LIFHAQYKRLEKKPVTSIVAERETLTNDILSLKPTNTLESLALVTLAIDCLKTEGLLKLDKLQKLTENGIKDRFTQSFFEFLIIVLDPDKEIIERDYDRVFPDKTIESTYIDLVYQCIHSNTQSNTQSALRKLYTLAKAKHDHQRQLIILHLLERPSPHIDLDTDLKELQKSILDSSAYQRVKPYIEETVIGGHNGKPTLLIITCIWQRFRLTKAILKYYSDLAERVSDRYEIKTLIVGSEGKPGYIDEFG